MSEPKLISPLLDNFAMGDPISEHNGVRCCPAMEKDTEDKYIVKIISVPAAQSQLEALLLSGAYPDKESALSYFQSVTDGIVAETEILQKLSALDGFVPYEKWQIVPMEDDTGFDIYLLSSYKKSLGSLFRHKPLTYLGALNLGLDLCAALAVCRRSGYLYVDLKPENIYITGDNEFRIGDIGFIKLDSLKYASLADRYRSQYTAPEIEDAFASLNHTIDIYAVGLILYQAFNDSVLPFKGDVAPGEVLPPPAYADYEMAEIIMKACAPDPADRWQDPAEMGQALVSYMQRNSVNDTPIVPVAVEMPAADDSDAQTDEQESAESSTTEADAIADETAVQEEQPAQPQTPAEENYGVYTEDEEGNITFLSDTLFDEPDPDQNPDEIAYEEVTEEASDILTQADDLIAHPTPDPVIPPEPIDVPIPDPLPIVEDAETTDEAETVDDDADAPAEETAEDDAAEVQENGSQETEPNEDEDAAESDDDEPYVEDEVVPAKKSNVGRWLWTSVLIILAAGLLVLGYMFYKNYYLQSIESINFNEITSGTMTVYVKSQTDESKLTVICSDTYGNQFRSPVKNGVARFTGLSPDSAYTVRIEIDGFHHLTGSTTTAFTTPVLTNIVQFQAVTGAEDGSAILNFTIEGPDAETWNISYGTEGEETKSVSFSGHMTTVTGLTVGKEYTFTLTPEEDMEISGTSEITHLAQTIVKAEDLQITGCYDNKLSAIWTAPVDATVESWTVRCYNESGFDETLVVNECAVTFEGIESGKDYTVEVSAAGMSVNQRAYAPANAINVTEFVADVSNSKQITLTWKTREDTSATQWVLLYTADNAPVQELQCNGNSATISGEIPGAKYTFTLKPADGSAVLGAVLKVATTDATAFSGYNVSASNMEFKMCLRPSHDNWDLYDVPKSDYSTSFTAGQKAGFVIHLNKSYKRSTENVTTVIVIRDANGNIVNTSVNTDAWNKMWTYRNCELNIPALPETPGEYSISVFFNGMLANQQNFTITS